MHDASHERSLATRVRDRSRTGFRASSSPQPLELHTLGLELRVPWPANHTEEDTEAEGEVSPWFARDALDKPTAVWLQFLEALPVLHAAREQVGWVHQAQERGRVIRAVCLEIEDSFAEAERSFVHIQRQLGVKGDDVQESLAVAVLYDNICEAAAVLLQLGSRTGLPADAWRIVLRFFLPLQHCGYATVPVADGAEERLLVHLNESEPRVGSPFSPSRHRRPACELLLRGSSLRPVWARML